MPTELPDILWFANKHYGAQIHGECENGSWDIVFPNFALMAAFVGVYGLAKKTTVFSGSHHKPFTSTVLVNIKLPKKD